MTWGDTDVRTLQRQADRRRRWGAFGLYAGAILFAFLAAFPFTWALISMFKQSNDLYVKENNPFWFSEAPTWSTSVCSSSTPTISSSSGTRCWSAWP